MKKGELKAKPVVATTTMKDKTYTRVPSPEPSDLLGEATQDDSLRSISVDDSGRVPEADSTTPRSANSAQSESSPAPLIKIMAIPEETRQSDDDNVTPSADDLHFTTNPLSDGVLLDSRPVQ